MKTLFSSRINFKFLKYLFAKNKMFLSIFSILLISLFPIPIIMRIVTRGIAYNDTTLLSFMAFFIPVTMILFGCIPFLFFNYLFSSRSVDTYHSLPIKRSDLFITLACAAFLFSVIPFTIAYTSGYLVAYFTGLIPMASAHFTLYIRLVIMFSTLTAISVLVIMNTGTISDALIYTGIISLLPFLAFTALNFFSLKYIFGFSSGITEFLILTSPHFATIELLTRFEGSYAPNIIASFWLLITIILTSVSICIYQKRQSEKSGHPFTNQFFFPSIASFFTGILLITFVSIWSSLDYAYTTVSIFNIRILLIPLLITLIIYILLSVIKNRSTKNMPRILKQYAIISVTTLFICFLFIQTGGFGYEKKLPNKANIVSVTLSNGNNIAPLSIDGYQVQFKDKENIDRVYALHSKIVNEYRSDETKVLEFNDYSYTEFTEVQISYKMSNGSSMSRTYFLNYKVIEELEDALFSKEVISKNDFYDAKIQIGNLSIYNASLTQGYTFTGNTTELRTAYLSDTANYTSDDWVRNGTELEYVIQYTVETALQRQIMVDSRMVSTLKYLQENTVENNVDLELSYIYYPKEKTENRAFYDPFHGFYIGPTRYSSFPITEDSFTQIDLNDAKQYTDRIVAYGYNGDTYDVLNVSGADSFGNYFDFWLPVVGE